MKFELHHTHKQQVVNMSSAYNYVLIYSKEKSYLQIQNDE